MSIFAQKQNQPLQKSSTNLKRSNTVFPAASHRANPSLDLQRTIGNQAVLRSLSARADGLAASDTEVDFDIPPIARFAHDFNRIPVQAQAPITIQSKLSVSTDDTHEQEADHISEQVIRMPEPQLQRACACGGGCPRCQMEQPSQEHQRLQTKRVPAGDTAPIAAPPIVHQVLASPGQPLDDATRAFMEPRFGHDFSAVRVHTDESAARSAHRLNAAAFTVGADIAFGSGCYAPASAKGRALLAHELAHVTQQAAGPRVLARQTVEQYETKGQSINIAKAAALNYWEQKIKTVFFLSTDSPTDARLTNTEEKDAVLSVAWLMRPQTAITQDITNVVTIPKRAAARTSQNLLYQITFKPRGTGTKDILEILFVLEAAGATAVAPALPSSSFRPSVAYRPSGFPQGGAAAGYWTAHPEQERRVRSWIETTAPAGRFDQLITTTTGRGGAAQTTSFQVRGTKDASGSIPDLIIVFLGAVAPSTKTASVDYASHDFADQSVEQAQTVLDPIKQDKLGAINGLTTQPPTEQASVKFAISQYFATGTRNAEVDAIVPIAVAPTAQPKRVLYTFRFKPITNDVDIQRIGEEGKDVSLAPQGDLAHVNGFLEHTKGATEEAKVKTLKGWLKKRYPSVTPIGTTIADVEKDVTAKIRAGSGDPQWFDTNYGIKILNETEAKTWLIDKVGHKAPEELKDLSKFSKTELQLLELVLEKMSDRIVKIFKGLRMIRQKTYNEWVGPPPGHFVTKPDVGGVTISPRTTRTTIIFDAASASADSLFLGGIGADGKPAVEIHTGLAVAHELGHTIAGRPGVKTKFDRLVATKQIKPITWYAASDPPKELFAESFALYYSDPEWLKQNWPDLYSFFDTLDKTGKPPP